MAESTTCTFNDGTHTYTVRARIIDKDGGYTEYTTDVKVNNVSPSVTGPVNQSSIEGENHAFDLGSFADPGADNPWTVSVDWGDGHTTPGTRSMAGGLGNSNHIYDDNGIYAATVTVTDKDGASDRKSFTVTVANVPPTAALSNNGPVNEGSPATISFSGQSDPSGPDTTAGFHYAYGCSGGSLAGSTYAGSSADATKQCTYPDNGLYPVSGRIIDKDGGYTDYTTTVTVKNVPPAVTAAADQSSNEGQNASFALGSFSDAGVNDAPWSVDVNWGDGSPHATFTAASQGPLGSQSHTYADNDLYTVTVKVTDKDNGNASATFKVNVANVVPAVTAAADQTGDEGTAKNVSLGSFSDPGADSPWAVDVDWGDNSTHTAFSAGSAGSLGSQSHTYADNGTYTVTVKVTDKNGGSGQATFKITVANVPPTVTSFTGSNVLAGGLVFGLSGSFNGSFTDPGRADNPWTASFTWDGVADPNPPQSIGANGTDTHTFTVRPQFTTGGCTKTATVKVTDKDGGYGTKSTTVQVGTGEFLPPMTNQPVTDKLKNGQVLPVKVRIVDCNGNPITGLNPAISLKKGDLTDGVEDNSTIAVTPDSVSSADTTGFMRYTDGFYMYNMRVNLPAADLGTPYTVLISPSITGYVGTMQLRHKIVATK
jgi:PKD repeat protein